jgi:hypothetical protein
MKMLSAIKSRLMEHIGTWKECKDFQNLPSHLISFEKDVPQFDFSLKKASETIYFHMRRKGGYS